MLNAMSRVLPAANGRGDANPATIAFLRWLAMDYEAQQRHYSRLRAWYDGKHRVPLTARQAEYLETDEFDWSINYLRLPVDLCVERLTIEGFDGPAGIGGDDGLLAEWWTSGRMDSLQAQVHRAAVRDGDTYLLIEWDGENNRPVFSHEPAFDGTEGMKVHYLSNLKREMTMASKVWAESWFDGDGRVQTVQRLNLYMPDRVEKYINSGRGWVPYVENDGDPWPIPWPVGIIPVVHFRWQDDGGNWGESELENLIPVQEMINKAVLDEAEVADSDAFRKMVISGVTLDSSTPISFQVNSILNIPAGPGGTTPTITVIPPGDLGQLRERINDYIIRIAQLAHIPLQYFQVTGQIASAATQAADDSQLVAKVAAGAVALGNAWEDAMYIALKLNAVYGDGSDLARGETIETLWADFERVDKMANEERRATVVAALVNAGASLPGALRLVGYPEGDIEAMLQSDTVTGVRP
jgi:hypothetical protein